MEQAAARRRCEKAKAIKGSRWVLAKAPEDLTREQRKKLRTIETDNQQLSRAYLLEVQLRDIFETKGYEGVFMIDECSRGRVARSSRPS